jgi:hypothetical protein
MDESQLPPESTPPHATPPSYGATPGTPPPASYGSPPPPVQPPPRTSGQGTAALVIGLFGIIGCCHVVSPVAWYLGQDELKDIRAGRVGGTGTNAKVGMILGIVGTCLLVIDLLWAFLFGGLAFVARMIGGHFNLGGHGI